MGCRIITGNLESRSGVEAAVLYCSTTMVAFGPVMGSMEEAEKFCTWMTEDPRTTFNHEGASGLMAKYNEFVRLYVCECGTVRDDDCPNCKEQMPLENGKHKDDDGEVYKCYFEPEPAAGQRYECKSCAKDRAASEAKHQRALEEHEMRKQRKANAR